MGNLRAQRKVRYGVMTLTGTCVVQTSVVQTTTACGPNHDTNCGRNPMTESKSLQFPRVGPDASVAP